MSTEFAYPSYWREKSIQTKSNHAKDIVMRCLIFDWEKIVSLKTSNNKEKDDIYLWTGGIALNDHLVITIC